MLFFIKLSVIEKLKMKMSKIKIQFMIFVIFFLTMYLVGNSIFYAALTGLLMAWGSVDTLIGIIKKSKTGKETKKLAGVSMV